MAFLLAIGQRIETFERGMLGMRVGTQRRAVVSSELAYRGSASNLIPLDVTLTYAIGLITRS
ncbi:MAG: hypothetical protein CL483_10815 [Acidobacteria bacterium]|nr:hypothetical protein [Acidobacteriota bacterium]